MEEYYWTLTKKRGRFPANHKQDVVTLGLLQLNRAQCPLRHVWYMAEAGYLHKIGTKKEEGRNGSILNVLFFTSFFVIDSMI